MTAVLYVISLPLSGLFAIRCFRATDRLRRYVSFLSLSVTRRNLIASILKERAAIVREIEKKKEEYLRSRGEPEEKAPVKPTAAETPSTVSERFFAEKLLPSLAGTGKPGGEIVEAGRGLSGALSLP